MKLRIIPLAIAVLLPVLAYYVYIIPTNATVAALETRIALAGTQADTIAAASLIKPRVQRERAQIAARLVRVQALSVPNAEARFLAGASTLATTSGVRVTSMLSKGKLAPFGSTPTQAPSGPPSPGPVSLPVVGASQQQSLAVRSLADGITLSWTLTVSGSLAGILRFIDGVGSLPTPVLVKTVTLGQGDRLQATIDCDLVVVDPSELREAQRVPPAAAPLSGRPT